MRVMFFCCLLFLSTLYSDGQLPGKQPIKTLLPNGWSLTPAGKSLPLGDLPLNMAVSHSKKLIAVTNNGYSDQSIQLIDVQNEKIVDSMPIQKSWYGLKFSADDNTLYASGGNNNCIYKYAVKNSKLQLVDTFILGPKLPTLISPAGIELDDANNRLYTVTKESDSLYVFNTKTKALLMRFALGGEGYSCVLSPNKQWLYISCWGCDQVKIFNTRTMTFAGSVQVGDNPNELCLSRTGTWLFVANGNDNSVSVIDTKLNKVVEVLNTALFPGAPPGSTPNGIALSEDEKTLFIANADNNCLAVFDISKPGESKSKGFIPTGWYPTNVKVVGEKIFVANGKGFSSHANPYGPNPLVLNQTVVYQQGDSSKPTKVQHIGGLFRGSLSIIQMPSEKTMAAYSAQVYQNTPYTKAKEKGTWIETGNPIPAKQGTKSPIKYVFYVIKENRTYDQVLGDIKDAAGDSSLVLFGENITPNLHALAKQFVLLDNFYCNAEVSADGHNWSMG
ncbi:MAG: YncE family protein, partial [Bacteroidota bacterium]|nr:YncE family protein [Bacteroidota bacterium]